jgi:hypothetical protein
MTRLWSDCQPLKVTAGRLGEPLGFVWQGKPHRVDEVLRRWRVDEGWWAGRAWREYFRLSTTSGLLVVIYRNVLTGQWCLERLYD